MSDLSKYRKKRDPAKTNEPFSAERASSNGALNESGDASAPREGETLAGRFVVHQHAARRMHYDLRLPIAGQLASFAVPQGPSLDAKVKRLAVKTEDHPLEYLDFEDTIPDGNYGAGSMIVWDTGGVVYNETSAEEGIRRGKIDFTLRGFKLGGRFALIATGRRKAASGLAGTSNAVSEWLLVKKPDAEHLEGSDICVTAPRSVLSGLTVAELARREVVAGEILDFARELGASPLDRVGRSKSGFRPPMVCQTEGAPRRSSEFLYELKLDGVRILAERSRSGVSLTYRSGRSATQSYAEVARSVRSLCLDHVVLDGEIVTFDETGRPNFERLAPRIRTQKARDRKRVELEVPVVYLAFDVLEVGHGSVHLDLRSLPLEQRCELRTKLLAGSGYVRSLDHILERGDALWELVLKQELEGMVAKRRSAPYEHGPRPSPHWVKLKRAREEEFVIVGYTPEKDATGSLGALLVASYAGSVLEYRGRVGSGFERTEKQRLLGELVEHATSHSPLRDPLPTELKTVSFVRPELVARVRHQGFSEDGHLRAAVYLGLRDDVAPRDCRVRPHSEHLEPSLGEPTAPPSEDGAISKDNPATSNAQATSLPKKDSRGREKRLGLTNLSKVFWPEEGYTKGRLLEYYEAIAPFLLPHLRGRPVVLVRYPDGIAGKSFYQWRLPEHAPSFMRSQELYDEDKQRERGTGKAAFLIDDVDSLLYVINLGCIPIHVLASRETTPAHCDFLTIDFDLGDRPLADAIRLALDFREVLESLGLRGFPKTSGQRGLHVLVPLGPFVNFQSAKLLTELLGRLIVGRHPEVCTMQRMKDKRAGKLYIDTGQTGRSRTIVAPYSVRAYPGATVSTPLGWDEVHLALDPSRFHIESVPERLEKLGDPLAGVLEERPELEKTLATLASWTGR